MKRTPFFQCHKDRNATMVEFGGWEMPVHYTTLVEEHTAVRSRLGVFDVSHMGRVAVKGPDRKACVDFLVTNDVAGLPAYGAHYALLCNERGTVIDDVIVYSLPEYEFIVINAGNRDKDLAHIRDVAKKFNVTVEDWSDQWAMLSIQGPRAIPFLKEFCSFDMSAMPYYSIARGKLFGLDMSVGRTGYTGEDGVEIFFDAARATEIWNALFDKGAALGILPVGLGARDTLRLEAGMPLYGHEIDDATNPLEAGLGFAVKLKKKKFIGLEALRTAKEQGPTRKLVGWEVEGKRVPRQGYPMLVGGTQSGAVTSGTFSPTFQKALGMGYLPVASAEIGTRFEIDVRGKTAPAVVVKKPFYKRGT